MYKTDKSCSTYSSYVPVLMNCWNSLYETCSAEFTCYQQLLVHRHWGWQIANNLLGTENWFVYQATLFEDIGLQVEVLAPLKALEVLILASPGQGFQCVSSLLTYFCILHVANNCYTTGPGFAGLKQKSSFK